MLTLMSSGLIRMLPVMCSQRGSGSRTLNLCISFVCVHVEAEHYVKIMILNTYIWCLMASPTKELIFNDVLHVLEIRKNFVFGWLLNNHEFYLVFKSNNFVLTKKGYVCKQGLCG